MLNYLGCFVVLNALISQVYFGAFMKFSRFGYLASFGAFSMVVALGVFFHWMRLCGEFLGSFLAFPNLVPVNVILSWLLSSFVGFYMATFLTCFLITCCHGCHIAIYNFL